jgi:hypothetical protein
MISSRCLSLASALPVMPVTVVVVRHEFIDAARNG